MAKNIGIVDATGTIINTVAVSDAWTGAQGEWQAPAGHTAVEIIQVFGIGDTYDTTTKRYMKIADSADGRVILAETTTEVVSEAKALSAPPSFKAKIKAAFENLKAKGANLPEAVVEAFTE